MMRMAVKHFESTPAPRLRNRPTSSPGWRTLTQGRASDRHRHMTSEEAHAMALNAPAVQIHAQVDRAFDESAVVG